MLLDKRKVNTFYKVNDSVCFLTTLYTLLLIFCSEHGWESVTTPCVRGSLGVDVFTSTS